MCPVVFIQKQMTTSVRKKFNSLILKNSNGPISPLAKVDRIYNLETGLEVSLSYLQFSLNSSFPLQDDCIQLESTIQQTVSISEKNSLSNMIYDFGYRLSVLNFRHPLL